MTPRCVLIVVFAMLPAISHAQTPPGAIPAGTPLALGTDQNYPMRAGTIIRAYLLYPIYADNQLLLPKGTVVTGSVVTLHPNRGRRINAMLGGDFTPFRIPDVHFTQLILAGGATVPFASAVTTNGAPVYRAVSPPPSKGGFFRQEFNSGLNAARSDLAIYIAPGKGDRLLQFIYGRLPYHPQRIEKGTSWTVETTSALDLPPQPAESATPEPPTRKPHFWEVQTPPAASPSTDTSAWIVQANLSAPLSSRTSKTGQPIQAVVAEPIFNPDHSVAVPQGATLVGAVTKAKPARYFGRTGVLSFSFKQLILPNAETQTVETRLTGADTAQNIALNSEGQAKSRPQDKISLPIILALLAARPLDQDCHHSGGCSGNTPGKSGVGGAAGLGLVGTIVGIAGGSPNVAAGIGYWGAARAVYARWIARGQQIDFAKDTRIVVETTPRRAAPIKPDAMPSH